MDSGIQTNTKKGLIKRDRQAFREVSRQTGGEWPVKGGVRDEEGETYGHILYIIVVVFKIYV